MRKRRTRCGGKKRKIPVGALRRGCRGSYTVEAAFLYPILVFLIAFVLTLSMNWYENVRQAAEDTEELRELDTRSDFLGNGGGLMVR